MYEKIRIKVKLMQNPSKIDDFSWHFYQTADLYRHDFLPHKTAKAASQEIFKNPNLSDTFQANIHWMQIQYFEYFPIFH